MNLTKLLLCSALTLSTIGQYTVPILANEITAENEKEGLTLSASTAKVEIDLSNGNTTEVEFTITGPSLNGYSFGYKSNKSNISSIEPKGSMVNRKWTFTITGKGIGSNTCSVYILDTDTKEIVSQIDIDVTVKDSSITGLVLSDTELTLARGQTKTLTITNPSAESVLWASSDTSIATVDGNGKIIAVKEGNATITASTASGLSATCSITVRKPVVTLSASTDQVIIDLSKKESETITIALSGDLYNSFNINLVSDSNAVFPEFQGQWTNAQRELKLTGKALGEGKVTITLKDGTTKEVLGEKEISVKVINSQTNPISINKTEITLPKEKEETLSAVVNTNDSVTWSSSDESIATVESGKVTAIKPGTAVITATNKAGNTATCTVTVTEPSILLIASTNDITIDLSSNKTENLSIRYEGELYVPVDIKFTPSSNFVSVDSDTQWNNQSLNMSITGKRAGEGDVTVTIKEKDTGNLLAQAIIHVTVIDENGSSISLNNSDISLVRGRSATLSALTREESITWSSSNENIATVENGTVTALKAGTAIISATTPSGSSAQCIVTVIEPNVSLSSNPEQLSFDLGNKENQNVEISCVGDFPKDYDLKINKSSSFIDVAIASGMKDQKFSLNVEPKTVGTGYVSVKFLEKGKSEVLAELEIPVTVTDSRNIEPTSISLSETSLDMTVGTSQSLKATIEPADASNKTIIWSSSNEGVATVIDGKVSAAGLGKATITATTSNGKTASCEVNVVDLNAKVEGYTLSLSGNIGVNFYTVLSQDVINNAESYIKFTAPNGKVSTIMVKDGSRKDGYYIFPCFVSAKDMTGKIIAELYVGNRKITQFSYSVEEYANYLINHPTEFDEKSVSIAKAMLTYGYYSQEYFEYKTDQLPATKNDLETIDLSKYDYELIDTNDSIEFIGAQLLLKTKTGIKLYFIGDGNYKVNGKAVQTTKEKEYTVITLSDIDRYDEEFTISAENFTLKYGVFSYGKKALESSNEALKNLIKSMHAYNQIFK